MATIRNTDFLVLLPPIWVVHLSRVLTGSLELLHLRRFQRGISEFCELEAFFLTRCTL